MSVIDYGWLLLLLLGGGKKSDGPTPDPDPNKPLFIPGVIIDPYSPPQPPPDTPDPAIKDVVDDYPTAGKLYQIGKGDLFLGTHGIAFKAIAQEAYKLATADGHNHDAALAYAKEVANASARSTYLQAIQCEPWNDQLYGTFGYGEQAVPAPSGRAIRLYPQHAPNLAQLQAGLPPVRSIRLRTPNDKRKGNGTAAPGAPSGHYELLWLPPIDLDHMKATGQVRTFRTGPPAFIAERAFIDKSGLDGWHEWGC